MIFVIRSENFKRPKLTHLKNVRTLFEGLKHLAFRRTQILPNSLIL